MGWGAIAEEALEVLRQIRDHVRAIRKALEEKR